MQPLSRCGRAALVLTLLSTYTSYIHLSIRINVDYAIYYSVPCRCLMLFVAGYQLLQGFSP